MESLEEEADEISGEVVVADAGFFCEEAKKSFRASVRITENTLTIYCPHCEEEHYIPRFRNY